MLTTDVSTEINNARIVSTYIGGWDGSLPPPLVVGVMFEGDGWGQGSGYWSGHTEDIVAGVCKALRVSCWEKVVGSLCRVKWADGRLVAVGHIIKDQWYTFGEVEV